MARASGPKGGELSEFFMLIGEKVMEGAHRLRVEAIKATRVGRIRMEMMLVRRDRRASVYRLGEAAHAAIRDGRVADPLLVALAREIDDIDATLESKADEATRIAELPDEAIVGPAARKVPEPAASPAAAAADESADDAAIGSIPVTRREAHADSLEPEPAAETGNGEGKAHTPPPGL